MKKIFALIFAFIMVFVLTVSAHATLNDNLDGTITQIRSDNSVLMWLKNANTARSSGFDSDGKMNWDTANAWIASLNSGNYLGYNDWRLPINLPVNGISYNHYFSYDGSTDNSFNIFSLNSELSYLYHVELGNLSFLDSSGAEQAGGGLVNRGPFIGLQSYNYWSGTANNLFSTSAWMFRFEWGNQQTNGKGELFFATAVRDGDVAPPPPVFRSPTNGFESPLGNGPVTVKKNRVLPLKVELRNENNDVISDGDITSPPVLQVFYDSGVPEEDPEDVTEETLSTGWGTEGNRFEYDISTGLWRFNLKTKNYTAVGTYTLSIISGDAEEYTIDSSISASFVIN